MELSSNLLERIDECDSHALETLVSIAYKELRGIAGALMRGQLNGQRMQPAALVSAAYPRLAQGGTGWESKAHFFGSAARAMRQVLVGHARKRQAPARDPEAGTPEPQLDLLRLDEAMTALQQVDEHFVRVMELLYFAGCSLAEVAELAGCSLATARRDTNYARGWLYDYMKA
jgi:RNA polymerase sigma factor (TIGR02999 family)